MCDRVQEIRGAGAELFVIGSGSPQQARGFAEDQTVPIPVLTDPTRASFRAIQAKRGLVSSLRLETFWKSVAAWRRGFRSNSVQGDPLQQGAVWVVRPGGEVIYRYTSAWAGDHPDSTEIVGALSP